MAHAEAEMLPVRRLSDVREIARWQKERHARVAESERGEMTELRGEVERQLVA